MHHEVYKRIKKKSRQESLIYVSNENFLIRTQRWTPVQMPVNVSLTVTAVPRLSFYPLATVFVTLSFYMAFSAALYSTLLSCAFIKLLLLFSGSCSPFELFLPLVPISTCYSQFCLSYPGLISLLSCCTFSMIPSA
jgi:hypothetical protein